MVHDTILYNSAFDYMILYKVNNPNYFNSVSIDALWNEIWLDFLIYQPVLNAFPQIFVRNAFSITKKDFS